MGYGSRKYCLRHVKYYFKMQKQNVIFNNLIPETNKIIYL
jgi:hypothetical protein